MKKVIAFLLVLFIFVSPVTTLVKADVVIGDNDETIINENATILGRKIALMESLSDLALSGVTEFTISNTNDVDSYLDSLWSEINDAIDYLDSGEWVGDLQDSIASRYFTNLVQYKDYINNRGDYFAHLLPSGDPTSNLLSTFFANNIFGKHSTLHNNLSLDTFRSLSRIGNNNPLPSPPLDYQFYIDFINGSGFFFANWTNRSIDNTGGNITQFYPYYNYSYVSTDAIPPVMNGTVSEWQSAVSSGIIDVNITSLNGQYFYTYNSNNIVTGYYYGDSMYGIQFRTNNQGNPQYIGPAGATSGNYTYTSSNFNSLTELFSSLERRVKNVNIYVDGVPWSIVDSDNNNVPTLDIDGYLKLFGNDNPQQYNLQPGTKIDYDQLYQVIYNAIRDNLPISQGDIYYYDSHDTIYSPTIINNYGEEEGDESDLIDTILDYAVIPKFDTAIAQPMRSALTNGVVIMNNSITNVIPQEILIILGACFFLLLFAVVINRMIK